MIRPNELWAAVSLSGLGMDTWSPGDGVTRYRFFRDSGADYFGGESLYTALGRAEAMTFLRGYIAGCNAPEEI